MKKFIFAVAFVATLFVSCSTTKAQKNPDAFKLDPAVVTGQLDNGMSYFVLKNDYPSNRISLRLAVKVGSISETDAQSGVAHLIEHMCFNGTEHFEKNSLINYAESIGMDFGAEVNAYTNFEETVYKLEVPADNPEFLETALLIFHDWASAVTFDAEELDKERGVVTEEWRGHLGLNGRITDAMLPFELKDSSYVNRLPIGSMDVIANITRDEVVAFYEKWYQPQNMAVIICGDIDTATAENLIKEKMGVIPAAKQKNIQAKAVVPEQTQKDVLVFADAEMPYTQVQMFSLDHNVKPMTTQNEMLHYYLTRIVDEAINARYSEITTDPDAPWLMASTVNSNETSTVCLEGNVFVPKDGMLWDAFARIIDETDRVLLFGITQTEFERVRDSIIATEKNWYEHAETTESASRAGALCTYFLTGETYISDADYIEAALKVLEGISLEQVNDRAKEIFEGRGTHLFIAIPKAYEDQMPSKEEIIDFWENYQSQAEMSAYEDNSVVQQLMERPAKKASVVSTKALDALGTNEYVLSNGVKLLVKKTDFDKSMIYMTALSKGGYSLVSDSEFASCLFSPYYVLYSGISGMDINQLQKFIGDKSVGFNIVIDEHDEKFLGQVSSTQIETLLQLANRYFSEPQFTDVGWNYISLMMDAQSKQYCITPTDIFNQEIANVLYGDSIRHKTGVAPEIVAGMNQKEAERLFRERFANIADFTFVFCGDIDEEKLVELCCYYLGTVPASTAKESGKYEPYSFPAGITQKVVSKGQDEKGQVFIGFGGKLPASKNVNETYTDIALISQLRALVEIRLREIIREDKSGTYGVNVYTNMDGYPDRYYEFQISFGCEPAREKELVAEVIAALNELRTKPVDQTYIDKINESYRRNFEANQKDSSWWLNTLNAIEVLTYMPAEAATNASWVTDKTTAATMQELAVKYLNTNNYVTVYLEPEK